MAIVQVSRITNRKGVQENLPQLAGAELGWCVDTRKLYIGNGTLQEGAPIVGNTEILTEFSDIAAITSYTYADEVVGYAAQTGPTTSDPVVRTVQQKLDDFADVRDFGAVGDGSTDDTDAINRALYQLYCINTTSQIRRSLYFPAGTYNVSDTIIIPTYAKLVGEGADCTIIRATSSMDYVSRYGDSLQQTGANIGNNDATPPRNIEISGMTFSSVPNNDIFLVEDATQCYFDKVYFAGPLSTNDIIVSPTGVDTKGVEFSSSTNNTCNLINFDSCRFSGLTYGIHTDESLEGATVSNSKFDTLYQGINLSDGGLGGPTGFRAVHNMFDNVYAQGIVYDNISLNASAHNIFYDVGNYLGSTPSIPVISFGNDNNVSITDLFERTDDESNVQPRVAITAGSEPTGGTQLQLGRYARESGRTYVMTSSSSGMVFSINSDNTRAFSVDYTVVTGNAVRHGTMMVSTQIDGGVVSVLNYSDDYTDNGISADVTLMPTQSLGSSTVSLTYTTGSNSGNQSTLTYSVAHLA